jgi:hypothetical protein
VRRAARLLAGVYLVVAAGNRVAERFGAGTCGCADDCWCHRSRLNLFRWVFPWRHSPVHDAEEKAERDRTDA